jgi:prephenate dehydrogenase
VPPRLFERAVIAGVGLIGGSLALAARAAGLVGEIVGYGRTVENLETALRRGIIDRYDLDPAAAARDADLLLLAVPAGACAPVARACAPALQPGAVVTDAASVKVAVVEAVEAALPPGVPFVGAHPIAGTEDSGAAAAFADLFRGRRCILTPGARATPAAVAKVRALWEGVGMRVDAMPASQHDTVLAWVSHLPHALAFSAVNAVCDADEGMAAFAGPSFGDLTRVAAASPEMWRDIFLANASPLREALDAVRSTLAQLEGAMAAGDGTTVERLLKRAQAARRRWPRPTAPGGGVE